MVVSSVRQEPRQRGGEFKLQLIENLDWLSLEQTATELDCSLAEVEKLVESGGLIAVSHDKRVLVPADQFSGGKLRPHLSEILQQMAIESPWLRLSWLVSRNDRLGGTSPLESLERCPEAVLSVARGVGVQGGA